MHQAIEAFKTTFAAGVAERPEDIRSADELDTMIHQARAELGGVAMSLSVQAAVVHGLEHRPRCCGDEPMKGHHRPKLCIQSVQGKHEAHGVSYRCESCGRVARPVHELLGVVSYAKTTVLFERLSADFFLDKGAPTAVRRLKEHHGVEPGRTTVLDHVEKRAEQARHYLDRRLQEASNHAEERRGYRAPVEAIFVQMDSSSGKTVQPLARPEVAEYADVERTPVLNLPKVKRPVEGRQVKLLCAQPEGSHLREGRFAEHSREMARPSCSQSTRRQYHPSHFKTGHGLVGATPEQHARVGLYSSKWMVE
jgi:hypothetical protein